MDGNWLWFIKRIPKWLLDKIGAYYILKEDYAKANHKVNVLRELLEKELQEKHVLKTAVDKVREEERLESFKRVLEAMDKVYVRLEERYYLIPKNKYTEALRMSGTERLFPSLSMKNRT